MARAALWAVALFALPLLDQRPPSHDDGDDDDNSDGNDGNDDALSRTLILGPEIAAYEVTTGHWRLGTAPPRVVRLPALATPVSTVLTWAHLRELRVNLFGTTSATRAAAILAAPVRLPGLAALVWACRRPARGVAGRGEGGWVQACEAAYAEEPQGAGSHLAALVHVLRGAPRLRHLVVRQDRPPVLPINAAARDYYGERARLGLVLDEERDAERAAAAAAAGRVDDLNDVVGIMAAESLVCGTLRTLWLGAVLDEYHETAEPLMGWRIRAVLAATGAGRNLRRLRLEVREAGFGPLLSDCVAHAPQLAELWCSCEVFRDMGLVEQRWEYLLRRAVTAAASSSSSSLSGEGTMKAGLVPSVVLLELWEYKRRDPSRYFYDVDSTGTRVAPAVFSMPLRQMPAFFNQATTLEEEWVGESGEV
ncbi:hypothetical protein DFJ73DRAFT_781992 [Zopfochytrium polystomum]|nr:hypothetical protein DFJ73DRAFT_781992 [Zopfochytrium polystomum]